MCSHSGGQRPHRRWHRHAAAGELHFDYLWCLVQIGDSEQAASCCCRWGLTTCRVLCLQSPRFCSAGGPESAQVRFRLLSSFMSPQNMSDTICGLFQGLDASSFGGRSSDSHVPDKSDFPTAAEGLYGEASDSAGRDNGKKAQHGSPFPPLPPPDVNLGRG